MNILVLYQSPWWNAAAYYTYNVVKALKQMNHNVVFAGKAATPLASEISKLGIEINDIDLFTFSPFHLLGNLKKTKKLISQNNINVLVPVSAPAHILIGILKKYKFRNMPILKICLDNVPPVNNVLNRYLHNRLTDYFLFPGLPTKNRYDKIFAVEKFKILHAPLDLTQFTGYTATKKTKEVLEIPGDKIVVCFIGRFSPEKGIFFLLDIIKAVIEKTDKIFFILSGQEGQIKHVEVQQKVKEYGLDKFVKIIDRLEDVRDLISVTDIGLLSSRYSEFICRIAMEFMAFEVPVVAPRLNVIPEVVKDTETGFIYDLNDSNQAANFILSLSNEEKLRETLGKNALKRMEEIYNLKHFKLEFEEILTLF